jgi:NAD(P)-dependent dehydrogenase (short-subunit alcohol dehydrogenase family)
MADGHNMSGKVAVVTGGGASVGRAIAENLARRGCAVAIAERDMVVGQAVEAAIKGAGGKALAVQTDVTDNGSVERMLEAALKEFGQVDYLVNNAGILGPIKPVWDITDADIEGVYDINVRAVVSCTRIVLRHMMQRKTGAIVTLASVAGKDGPKDMSIYASSKAAVIGFTKSWGKELAPHGIRVNCIAPSLIGATGMQSEMPAWFGTDSVARIPMGRPAHADEVANIAAFLLSDEASFVTCACYDVSGGRASY